MLNSLAPLHNAGVFVFDNAKQNSSKFNAFKKENLFFHFDGRKF